MTGVVIDPIKHTFYIIAQTGGICRCAPALEMYTDGYPRSFGLTFPRLGSNRTASGLDHANLEPGLKPINRCSDVRYSGVNQIHNWGEFPQRWVGIRLGIWLAVPLFHHFWVRLEGAMDSGLFTAFPTRTYLPARISVWSASLFDTVVFSEASVLPAAAVDMTVHVFWTTVLSHLVPLSLPLK